MRVVLLVLALLAPGVAAQAAPAAGPTGEWVLHNDGAAIYATVELVDAAGTIVDHHEMPLAAGQVADVSFPLPPGEYEVHIRDQTTPAPDLLQSSLPYVQLTWSVDTRGCDGRFRIDARFAEFFGPDYDATGCIDQPAAMRALLDDVSREPAGTGHLDVPVPGAADVAEVRAWSQLGDPDFSQPGRILRWAPDVRSLDAWGRVVDAQVVSFQHGLADAYAGIHVGGLASTTSDIEQDNLTDELRFVAGDAFPFAEVGHAAGAELGVQSGVSVLDRLSILQRSPAYACMMRNALQGARLDAGATLDAAHACAGWSGYATSWRLGAPRERDGLRMAPLDGVSATGAARVWLADGVPYPIDILAYARNAQGVYSQQSYHLAGLRREGAPIANAPASPAAPHPPLAPLDPLRGPAGGGARFVFTLAQASDAARADLTQRDLQAVLADPKAVLVAALYGTQRDAQTGVTEAEWRLAFTAPGRAAQQTLCRLAEGAPTAAIRCAPGAGDVGGPTAGQLVGLPIIGSDALPPAAASWNDALSRWDADGAAQARVERAGYSAADDGGPSRLWVGSGARNVAPSATGRTQVTTRAGVALATGGALFYDHVATTRAPLGSLSIGLGAPAAAAATTAPANGASLPLVAGVAGGITLLALVGLGAWLLFTRLRRPDVLASSTRAEILSLVEREPGLHASAILERVGLAHGVGEYHLSVLVREGFLTCVELPGFRRYFAAGKLSAAEMQRAAILRDAASARLLAAVEAAPGIGLTAAARAAGLSLPQASRTAKRLVDSGLLQREREGVAVRLRRAP